jgi:putative transcriptional regulator
MTKRAFDKIAAGLNDAIAIANGTAEPDSFRVHIPKTMNVRAVRKGLNLTQEQFALRFGWAKGTIRDWEQGRSTPRASDRVLLKVLETKPEAVLEALELT